MNLSDQVISLALAKRLKELGVKQESYFWWRETIDPAAYANGVNHEDTFISHDRAHPAAGDFDIDYAAFTVAELGEMLPEGILVMRPLQENEWDYKPEGKYLAAIASRDGKYLSMNEWFIDTDLSCIQYADTEADVRAKMLVYLIENKLI